MVAHLAGMRRHDALRRDALRRSDTSYMYRANAGRWGLSMPASSGGADRSDVSNTTVHGPVIATATVKFGGAWLCPRSLALAARTALHLLLGSDARPHPRSRSRFFSPMRQVAVHFKQGFRPPTSTSLSSNWLPSPNAGALRGLRLPTTATALRVARLRSPRYTAGNRCQGRNAVNWTNKPGRGFPRLTISSITARCTSCRCSTRAS